MAISRFQKSVLHCLRDLDDSGRVADETLVLNLLRQDTTHRGAEDTGLRGLFTLFSSGPSISSIRNALHVLKAERLAECVSAPSRDGTPVSSLVRALAQAAQPDPFGYAGYHGYCDRMDDLHAADESLSHRQYRVTLNGRIYLEKAESSLPYSARLG